MTDACVDNRAKGSPKHATIVGKITYDSNAKEDRSRPGSETEVAGESNRNIHVARKRTVKIVCVGGYSGGWGKGVYIEDYKSSEGDIVENPINLPVVGADFSTKCLCDRSGEEIRVVLWNTAEHERFFATNKAVYKNADGAVVFWGAKSANMDSALKFHREVSQIAPDIPFVLLVDNVFQTPVIWIGDGMATKSRVEMDAFCAQYGFFAWYEMRERAGGEDSVFAQAIRKLVEEILSRKCK